MSFNKSGYSSYCREFREYWEWVEKRNDARYQNTLSHGKNYDAKNLMHTFRLLDMAETRIANMEAIYEPSGLPEMPDLEKVNKTLIEVRKEFYQKM